MGRDKFINMKFVNVDNAALAANVIYCAALVVNISSGKFALRPDCTKRAFNVDPQLCASLRNLVRARSGFDVDRPRHHHGPDAGGEYGAWRVCRDRRLSRDPADAESRH